MAGLASEADWVFIPEWPPQKGWEDMLCKKLATVSIHIHSDVIGFLNDMRYINLRFTYLLTVQCWLHVING